MPWTALVRLSLCLVALAWVFPTEAEASPEANWPRFHHDLGNSGNNRRESILATSNVTQLTMLWDASTGLVLGGVAVAGGRAYVGSWDQHVYAFDAATGDPRWRVRVGHVASTPAIVDRTVYVAADRGVFALAANTGAILWRQDIAPTADSSPAVASGILYVGSWDNSLHALDARTGDTLWNAPTDGWVTSSPAVRGGLVYVGSWDGFMYAFDAQTGETVWSVEVGPVHGSPAVVGDVVYVTSGGETAFALDASSGEVLWERSDPGYDLWSAPIVAEPLVYIEGDDGGMHALRIDTGAEAWATKIGWSVTSGSVANGVVYTTSITLGGEGYARALDALTGAVLWSERRAFWAFGSPAVVNGQIFVCWSDGHRIAAYGLPDT